MKRKLLALSVLAVLPAVAAAEVTPEQLQALEARIAQLEAERAALPAAAPADTLGSKLKIDGFMSAGWGIVDEEDFYFNEISQIGTHNADGVVGVQLEGRVNERARAVLQLVGRSDVDDFNVTAEWAYAGFKPTDNDEVRVGLQRFPFFMMSEYLEVGYTYPWAKPPVEVYIPGMPSSYNGISWHHAIETSAWNHSLMAFWGSDEFSTSSGTFQLENSVGGTWVASTGDWQFSANFSRGESTFHADLFDALAAFGIIEPLDRDNGQYGGVGIQYDNGKLLVMTEANEIKVDGYFADSRQEYITVGYHFGKFMPHLTYASSRTLDGDERKDNPVIPTLCGGFGFCLDAAGTIPVPADILSRALESSQDSVTLGARYDFAQNAALKVDWTHVLDTHDTFGYFQREDGNMPYGAKPGDDLNIYRVVIDVVF